MYLRNGRFYGQIWMKLKKTARKFPLANADGDPVQTLNEAMEVLRNDRRENALPTIGHKAAFADYVETYFAKAEVARKKPGTLENEKQALKRWTEHFGNVRMDRVTRPMIATFKDKRLREGCSPRTFNLDQVALRNVLIFGEPPRHFGLTMCATAEAERIVVLIAGKGFATVVCRRQGPIFSARETRRMNNHLVRINRTTSKASSRPKFKKPSLA